MNEGLRRIAEEMRQEYAAIISKKHAAIKEFWPMAGRQVKLRETGEIFWARVHDIYVDHMIPVVVRYDLCKSHNMKRKIMTVKEEDLDLCE